jgi:hypothetical protein
VHAAAGETLRESLPRLLVEIAPIDERFALWPLFPIMYSMIKYIIVYSSSSVDCGVLRNEGNRKPFSWTGGWGMVVGKSAGRPLSYQTKGFRQTDYPQNRVLFHRVGGVIHNWQSNGRFVSPGNTTSGRSPKAAAQLAAGVPGEVVEMWTTMP